MQHTLRKKNQLIWNFGKPVQFVAYFVTKHTELEHGIGCNCLHGPVLYRIIHLLG